MRALLAVTRDFVGSWIVAAGVQVMTEDGAQRLIDEIVDPLDGLWTGR